MFSDKPATWKRVLNFLYQNASEGSFFFGGKDGFGSSNHPIAERLKLSGQELDSSLSFLDDQELIEDYTPKDPQQHVKLTQKGLDVAIQNEKFMHDSVHNVTMSVFTIILALVALSQTLAPVTQWITAVTGIGIVLMIGAWQKWTEQAKL